MAGGRTGTGSAGEVYGIAFGAGGRTGIKGGSKVGIAFGAGPAGRAVGRGGIAFTATGAGEAGIEAEGKPGVEGVEGKDGDGGTAAGCAGGSCTLTFSS